MKRMLKASTLLMLLSFTSCDEENGADFQESLTCALEVSIPDSVNINELFSIDLLISGSSGCAEFSRAETSSSGDTSSFVLYQKRDRNAVCTTQLIEINVPLNTSLNTSGMHYFRFDGCLTESLVDSVFVKE